jgi:hypothetical protein
MKRIVMALIGVGLMVGGSVFAKHEHKAKKETTKKGSIESLQKDLTTAEKVFTIESTKFDALQNVDTKKADVQKKVVDRQQKKIDNLKKKIENKEKKQDKKDKKESKKNK